MKCIGCGQEIPDGSPFCAYCGTQQPEQQPAQQVVQQPAQQSATQQPAPQPQYQSQQPAAPQGGGKKGLLIAGICIGVA
ncbi:MAG: zinc-ribbon domain-containing protein, partial [Eubacterium sp.]|nr:zinc-ribbon domain-containing protein [Eubacterium sp.]